MSAVTFFAPATVANLACGFDVLGLALGGIGDEVTIGLRQDSEVVINSVEGDSGKLPRQADKNTAGVAVIALQKLLGTRQGFDISLKKGLPLGSGLGSSAASGVAALVAANELLGSPLSRLELLPCAIEAEKTACGSAHADNVAPALLGGIVLVRSYQPLDVIRIDYPDNLQCVVVTPEMELNTSQSRSVLPKDVRLTEAVIQWGNLGGLIAGLINSDLSLISRSLHDQIAEPRRAVLIPGFYKVKKAAVDAGSLGCSISGSGPSVFAFVSDPSTGKRVMESMQKAFAESGLRSGAVLSAISSEGAVKK